MIRRVPDCSPNATERAATPPPAELARRVPDRSLNSGGAGSPAPYATHAGERRRPSRGGGAGPSRRIWHAVCRIAPLTLQGGPQRRRMIWHGVCRLLTVFRYGTCRLTRVGYDTVRAVSPAELARSVPVAGSSAPTGLPGARACSNTQRAVSPPLIETQHSVCLSCECYDT